MNLKTLFRNSILLTIVFSFYLSGQNYPDQQYILKIDSIFANIETSDGIELNNDGKSMRLQDGVTEGYFILKPQYSQSPFNQGLPSWNGTSPDNNSGFKIQMRFPYGATWSPWLTVGYWKSNIWSVYGSTSYGGGLVDIDYVKLNSYQSSWQFKIIMTRTSAEQPSPTLHALSFFVSDSRTTSTVNITNIVNDNPAEIFIPTEFVCQYDVDPVIGGDICSPTSVSMILKSYSIQVDPYQFALDTHDPYFDMFGIWPRVVQNASEFGLDGAVTRYRTWSEAREVLANGGRISMSVGSPLYPNGHLIMLAGFTTDGRPIVHDPAKSNGESYVYNKTSISQSWFNKGGISYTFYPVGAYPTSVENALEHFAVDDFTLYQNYPNPFNPTTSISFSLPQAGLVKLTVYDILGNEVEVLVNDFLNSGNYTATLNAANLSSGVYIYRIQTEKFVKAKQMILLK